MKRWFGLVLSSLLLAACPAHGPCCSNGDCSGSDICSADCRGNEALQGICLSRCQVDRDCDVDQVCNEIELSCGCEAMGDAGQAGTCAPGVD